MLEKIISGGQTGADIAGLIVAKNFGIPTGGWMTKDFLTQAGPRPEYAELYGMKPHDSPKYPGRTYANARDSDATIRFAYNLNSPGEICTLKALHQCKKPHIDIDLSKPRPHQEVVDFLKRHDVKVLNVAGNSERTWSGITGEVIEYLSRVLVLMGFEEKK